MGTWWWLGLWTRKWSHEENLVRQRIWGLQAMIFALICIPQLLVLIFVGIAPRLALIIGVLTSWPLSFIAGRRLCARLWPELTKTADENAAKRVGA